MRVKVSIHIHLLRWVPVRLVKEVLGFMSGGGDRSRQGCLVTADMGNEQFIFAHAQNLIRKSQEA